MHQQNMTTKCPTYAEILLLFPDTSNQKMSGGFVLDEYDFLHREPPIIHKHYEFYRHDGMDHLFIDPPYDNRFHMKRITIEYSLPTYMIPESGEIINNTLSYGHARWTDKRCQEATISSEIWFGYLGDTIRYLNNDCDPDSTVLDSTYTVSRKPMVIKIWDTYARQLSDWVDLMMEKCKVRWCH